MKKIFLGFILFLATTSFAQKTGYLDYNVLIQQMPEYKTANEQAIQITKDYQKELDKLLKELQEKSDSFTKEEKALQTEIKNFRLKELQDLQKKVEEFKKSAETSIAKQKQELLAPITAKAKATIEEVAKANGYNLVADSGNGNYVYLNPKDDLTDAVKKKLGIK
jgi:outer membrane protein